MNTPLPLTMIEPGLYGYKPLNGFWDFAAAGSGTVATAATTGALVTFGVSAQAVPVIGTIAGAVALLSAGILRVRGKAKAGQATSAQLRSQIAEVDALITQGNNNKANILAEMNRLGLSGLALDGFGDWLKKTFTPARYYGNEAAGLTAELENKIATAQALQTELETLQARLTKGKAAGLPAVINNLFSPSVSPTAKKVIVYGGGALIIGTTLYFIIKKIKS